MKAIALIVVVIASAAVLAACGPSSDMKSMDKKSVSRDGAMKDMPGMDMKGMDVKGMPSGEKAQGTIHKAVGVVKNVDPARSAVTLDHEPITSLGRSAMTMTFAVKDKALLDKLRPGRKVEFEFVQQDSENVITSVK